MMYLNGEFLAPENAKIPVDDRGFLLGDGLFETIRYEKGLAFQFNQHWSRLCRGCHILNIPVPLDPDAAQNHINQLIKQNQLSDCTSSVRITVTRGSGPRGLMPPKTSCPSLLIQCFEIPPKKETSISIMHSNITINELSPLRQFKSLAYTDHILARVQAQAEGYDDALLYNTKGFLVSATSANIFLIIDNELVTPPVSAGALPGIMRQHVMNRASQSGMPVSEKNLTQSDCLGAQHAFITNSIIQITPVHQLGERTLSLLDLNFQPIY